MRRRYNIEPGQRFGSLVVIREIDAIHYVKSKYPFRRVLCQCDCTNYKEVDYCNLVNGSTQSCGCETGVRLFNQKHLTNEYDLSNEYGIGYTTSGEQFLFDKELYDVISKYCWYKNPNGYIAANTTIYDEEKTIILLHRLVTGLTKNDNVTIDHIDRNTLDNRKFNLRVTTQTYNCLNKSKFKNNKSGVIGVGWSKCKKKWRAYIGLNNKSIHLGYFMNKDDAIRTRLMAELKYFGEFAPQQHLFEQYGINTMQNDCKVPKNVI